MLSAYFVLWMLQAIIAKSSMIGTVSNATTSPGAGSYASTQSVTFASTGSDKIYYTNDGSTTPVCPDPVGRGGTTTGTLYSGAISTAATTTYKVIGCGDHLYASTVQTFTYTITGASNPTYVSTCSDFTGGGTASCSVTAGNHLIVAGLANDGLTTNTCSDGTNTYVPDGAVTTGTGSGAVSIRLSHVKTLASSTTLTITCTGTTPAVMAIQYSGGTGDLDTTSAGTNPSTATGSSPLSPAAFTASTAATIHADVYGSAIGGTVTIAQTDTNFSTTGSCSTGASCFVGAIGHREVTSSSSLSNGFTITSGNTDQLAIHGAYK